MRIVKGKADDIAIIKNKPKVINTSKSPNIYCNVKKKIQEPLPILKILWAKYTQETHKEETTKLPAKAIAIRTKTNRSNFD